MKLQYGRIPPIGLLSIFLFSIILFTAMYVGMSQSHDTATAQQETYYVSTTGNDSTGDGSAKAPWATIPQAVNSVPDGSTISVQPGLYSGRIRLDQQFEQGIVIRSEMPYLAQLRNNDVVITSYRGQGITIEGFDIAHSGPGAGGLVIQIQDLLGEASGAGSDGTDPVVERIVLRNNVLHDSYNNDILKVNNGAKDVTVEGNVFYNQSGSDEHIDVNSVTNVVIQDNIFFNDFAGSGRVNNNDTSSYIVIKDSNGADDSNIGSLDITIRRNVFLNWEGSTGSNFVLIGEDGQPYFEAQNVLVENNLMLGNSPNVMRAAFGVKGGKAVTFRHNTVVGDLPALAYAFRINAEGSNPPSEEIRLFNNIWADPTGTMGAENPQRPNDFSDTPAGEVINWQLNNNLYWNGGSEVPSNTAETINVSDDSGAVVADPGLPLQADVVLPRWNPAVGQFNGGTTTISTAFEQLVLGYGVPATGSAAIDAANGDESPNEDILGRTRTSASDIGAVEVDADDDATATPAPSQTATEAPTDSPTETPTMAQTGTPTGTPTGTTNIPVCTPPPCPSGGTLVCGEESCPGGCGTICQLPSPVGTPVFIPFISHSFILHGA